MVCNQDHQPAIVDCPNLAVCWRLIWPLVGLNGLCLLLTSEQVLRIHPMNLACARDNICSTTVTTDEDAGGDAAVLPNAPSSAAAEATALSATVSRQTTYTTTTQPKFKLERKHLRVKSGSEIENLHCIQCENNFGGRINAKLHVPTTESQEQKCSERFESCTDAEQINDCYKRHQPSICEILIKIEADRKIPLAISNLFFQCRPQLVTHRTLQERPHVHQAVLVSTMARLYGLHIFIQTHVTMTSFAKQRS